MNATQKDNTNASDRVAVDIKELQSMLCIGRVSAEKIGEQAQAVIKIGRRKLYNVERVKAYIESISK